MATTYLEYPSTLASRGGSGVQHWISFKAFDFKSKGSQTLDIALYIPSDALQTSYKSSYEAASLGAVGGAAKKAADAFQATGGPAGGGGGIEGLKLLMASQASATGSEMGTVSLLKGAEKAAALGLGDTKTLMEQATGSVMNPYMVAAYKGPTDMREHKFSFKMLPQSESESRTCVKIVNSFKRAMLPSHKGGDNKTAPSMLFGYPDEFTIEYYIDGRPLPKDKNGISNPMFNIGRSVLTACDLNYTTQDVPLFFDGTQYPVSIDMALSFMEIGIMYREKIDQGF
jgi:hypothetical protein